MKGIFFSFSLLILASCSEDLLVTHPLSDCLNQETPFDYTVPGCIENPIDTTWSCEKIVIPETVRLTSSDKEWLPFYCCAVDDRVVYVDAQGSFTEFIVEDKAYGISTVGHNGFDDCNDGTDRHNLYCIDEEFARVSLSSTLLDLTATIGLQIEYEKPFSLPLKTGSSIKINTYVFNDSIIRQTNHFFAIVEQRELSPRNSSNLEFYDQIEVVGRTFYDVHSFRNVIDSTYVKMFYNKEFGLLGFNDHSGKEWVISQ